LKNNKGLVEYAKKALKEKWGYVWGTYGQVLTEGILSSKIKQYPSQVGAYERLIRSIWLNKRTADCIGLIKGYIWENGGELIYNANTDVNANEMYNIAKESGTISTIPDIPGICVYKKGHIGVYIGSNTVIEAHSTSTGVIQTPLKGLSATAWTHWLMVPQINYIGVENLKPILKLGNKGESVKGLQNSLIKLGYDLGAYGADGDFGNATDKAVRLFQSRNGLVSDGIVGEATWAKIDELLRLETVSPFDDKYKTALLTVKEIIDTALGE